MQDRRNDAVFAAHQEAVAGGEERVLRMTKSGDLHSYRSDEIGSGPAYGSKEVTSWWGLSLLAAVGWAMFAASWLIVFMPTRTDAGPAWGGLVVTVLGAGLGTYAAALARREYRARRTRRRRGVPEPSSATVPERWVDRGV